MSYASASINLRYAPGYRDVALMIEGTDREIWLDKAESENLLRQLLRVHQLAWHGGERPLDSETMSERRPDFVEAAS